jgi:hypothetical protein
MEPVVAGLPHRDAMRNQQTPCCKQGMHQSCWEKALNRSGRCPLCNTDLIPEEFMQSIHFSVAWEMAHGSGLEEALAVTHCFGKCVVRDRSITNPRFLGETVCFTDDLYWNNP